MKKGRIYFGGMNEPIPRRRRNSPSGFPLPPNVPIFLGDGSDREALLGGIMNHEWDRTIHLAKNGDWSPESEWLHFLRETVGKVVYRHKKALKDGFDYDLLVANLVRPVWEYFWKRRLPGQVCGAISLIRQLVPNLLEGGDATSRASGLSSRGLRAIGVKPKPGKPLVAHTSKQLVAMRRRLVTVLFGVFQQFTTLNISRTEEALADILLKLKITSGDKKTAKNLVHTDLGRS